MRCPPGGTEDCVRRVGGVVMFCALSIPDYRLQAALRYRGEADAVKPAAVVDAGAVVELNAAALNAGVAPGMSPTQALARCLKLQILSRAPAAEQALAETLLGIACGASAYAEQTAANVCTLDMRGLRIAEVEAWGMTLARRLASLQMEARVGIAANPDLALLATRAAEPVRVVADSTAFLAGLPLGALREEGNESFAGIAEILHGWGIATLGGLSRLKKSDVAARLGPEGVRLWERAGGRSTRLLRLVRAPERYEEAFDFERELESAQPLLFLLRRFVDALASRVDAAGLAVAELRLVLPLSNGGGYERVFRIPSPTSNADVLFRILDTHFENLRLEHAPVAVRLAAEPAKPERRQFRLFENAVRDPNRFAETLARVMAVVGSGNVGVPEMKPTHRPDRFALTMPGVDGTDEKGGENRAGFAGAGGLTAQTPRRSVPTGSGLPLRRYRPPISAQVHAEHGRPQYVVSDQAHGVVAGVMGPYRVSGEWWENGWSTEEWDIQMAAGGIFRISRHGEEWQVEGSYEVV